MKFMSHASLQSLSISLHISRITGIVLRPLAKPPAPVVSCPIRPYLSGIRSSFARASRPPT